MLRAHRIRVVGESAKFENPTAVLEYIDFFIPAIEEVVEECDRIAAEIPQRLQRSHIDMLRQIAANCRVEQRRLSGLPRQVHQPASASEQSAPAAQRHLGHDRDQLTAFYDLNNAAARLERIINTTYPRTQAQLGRRQLVRTCSSCQGQLSGRGLGLQAWPEAEVEPGPPLVQQRTAQKPGQNPAVDELERRFAVL